MEKIKSWLHPLRQMFLVSLVLMVICGLGFPLVLTGISAVIFPHQAHGSLVEVDGKYVGSEHVGQEFTEDYFMKGRPSAVQYNTYWENEDGTQILADGSEFGGVSSGSANYGASDSRLHQRVQADLDAFLAANPDVKVEDIPTDLLAASGSGLDPDISPAAAAVQLPAIAEASGLSMETLEEIVSANTEGKLLGLFGGETVNVLGVNVDIAAAMAEK